MTFDRSRPPVALHSDVVALLTDDTRAAIDLIEFDSAEALASAAVDAVRFLAAGPHGEAVAEQLPRFRHLEVLQTASAGTDWVEPFMSFPLTLCSARGARDAPVAEWILGALLGTSSQLLACSGAEEWAKLELRDLADWTVLLIGMGSIGHRVQTYLEPFGATLVGVASHARDGLHGIAELPKLLPDADAVVLLTPLTDATRHLISAPQLAAMKDGAVLINAARGAVLDTDALVAELNRGRIYAVLDVTDPEPLPAGHPLWIAPGVLSITPHIAGASRAGSRAAARLAADQLRRWLRGEPLENVVVSPER